MLCSRFKQILLTKTTTNNNVQYRCFINARFVSKRYGVDGFWGSFLKHKKDLHMMSSLRFILKDLSVNRLWSAWIRSVIVGHVVRRCRKDRSVREVIHNFRQTFFRPRKSLLLYATAACKAKNADEKPGKPKSCSKGISDEEMEALLYELDGIEVLSKQTLYCENCNQRLAIDKLQSGIDYCPCKDSLPPEGSPDGWEPYLEAEDVIVWRREYKKGQGLYAYKVYGRYNDVRAEDFAAVNVDAGYRRKWDNAVAALAVVERNTNGVPDQAVLHWEVLWPRLFANRDYVYVRRHKEYAVKSMHSPHLFDDPTVEPYKDPTGHHKHRKTENLTPQGPVEVPPLPPKAYHTDGITEKSTTPPGKDAESPPASSTATLSPVLAKQPHDRPSVHDNAKKKSLEMYSKEPQTAPSPPPSPPKPAPTKKAPPIEKSDKVYVIISRSCTHPDVPVTRNAIRVQEYWSHMVVKTLNGDDKIGMEFVLTYYDEPAVGGMPSGVTTWATGRATPVFLSKIRQAAKGYASYRKGRKEEVPDFTPFRPETKEISYDDEESQNVREEDMESSKTGPELNNGNAQDVGTQTDEAHPPSEGSGNKVTEVKDTADKVKVTTTEDKAVNTGFIYNDEETPTRPGVYKVECEQNMEDSVDEHNARASWWRYIYPPYYLG